MYHMPFLPFQFSLDSCVERKGPKSSILIGKTDQLGLCDSLNPVFQFQKALDKCTTISSASEFKNITLSVEKFHVQKAIQVSRKTPCFEVLNTRLYRGKRNQKHYFYSCGKKIFLFKFYSVQFSVPHICLNQVIQK